MNPDVYACAAVAHGAHLAPRKEAGSGGLLVVTATVKGFGRPLRVLIDSGASTYYARKQTMAENAELFQAAYAASREDISVRLATGVVVTAKRIFVDLSVKFEVHRTRYGREV